MSEAELRVGNLLIDAKGRICTVDSVSKEDGFKAYAIKGAITSFLVAPIPLTEEWLLKAGFNIGDHGYAFHPKLDPMFLLRPFDTAPHYLVKSYGGCKITSVKHVHQLQNLYFAIIGEELEFNTITPPEE